MIRDKAENIDNIEWRVDGKIKKITRTVGIDKKVLSFDYDAMGHRIAKHVINNLTQMPEKSTYYVLDAQGNTMNVYEHVVQAASGGASYSLAEKHIYGSSRLGMETSEVNMLDLASVSYTITHKQGKKLYELSNHLGNVLTVITDKIIPMDANNDALVDERQVYISSATDYSPFGVQLKERNLKKLFCTDETSTITTTNILFNYTFNAGVDGFVAASNSTTISNASQRLRIEKTSGGNNILATRKQFTVSTTGTNYVLSFNFDRGNLNSDMRVRITSNSNVVIFTQNISNTGVYSYNISNLAAGNYTVSFERIGNNSNNRFFFIDDVKLTYDTQSTVTTSTCLVEDYRFNFHSQESDNEIYGYENYINFKYRGYNPRLGRFFSVDPLANTYPYLSPYHFSHNSPIYMVEIEGLEGMVYVYKAWYDNDGYHHSAKPIDSYRVEGLKSNLNKTLMKPFGEPNGKTVQIKYSSTAPQGGSVTFDVSWKPNVKELNQFFGNKLPKKESKPAKSFAQKFNDMAPSWAKDGAMEGGDDAGNRGGDMYGEKGFYEKGLPLMAATVGTILTFGSGSVVGGAIAGGAANGTGNFLGQWGQTGDIGKVDLGSTFLAAGGGLLKNPWVSTAVTSTLDASFDLKINSGLTVVGTSQKNWSQGFMDLGFGLVGGTQNNLLQNSGLNPNMLNTRTFFIGGSQQYLNGLSNDKLEH